MKARQMPTNNRLSTNKGSVLVLGLMVVSVLTVLSAGFLLSVVNEKTFTEKSYLSSLAFHLAEAGAEAALWELNFSGADFAADEGWSQANPAVKTEVVQASSGETVGQYTVNVADPATSTPEISATGIAYYQNASQSESRIVKATVTENPPATFSYAAFTQNGVTVHSNACTDSFDSTLGPYDAATNIGSNGDVGTNSTADEVIWMASNSNIDGDVIVGVGAVVGDAIDLNGTASISGTQSVLTETVDVPEVVAPTGLPHYAAWDGVSDITQSGEYDNIELPSNSTLTITGDVTLYITGSLSTRSNTSLIISPGSNVEIYVDGKIDFKSNSTINNLTMDPTALSFYGTDSLVDDGTTPGIRFRSNTDIYATVLAEKSSVELNSNAEVFGAIISDNVEIHSNSCIHYDENLGASSSGSERFSVATWQEG